MSSPASSCARMAIRLASSCASSRYCGGMRHSSRARTRGGKRPASFARSISQSGCGKLPTMVVGKSIERLHGLQFQDETTASRPSFPPRIRLCRSGGGRPPWGVASASELGGSRTAEQVLLDPGAREQVVARGLEFAAQAVEVDVDHAALPLAQLAGDDDAFDVA